MKLENVRYTAILYFYNIPQTIKRFCTYKALRNWADNQYKNDGNCTIEVYTNSGKKLTWFI